MNPGLGVLYIVTKEFDALRQFFVDLGLEKPHEGTLLYQQLNQGQGRRCFFSSLARLISLEENTDALRPGPLYPEVIAIHENRLPLLKEKYPVEQVQGDLCSPHLHAVTPPGGGLVHVLPWKGPPTTPDGYLKVWDRVLRGWLSWSKSRIAKYTWAHRNMLQAPCSPVYSRWPIRYVSHALLEPALRERCNTNEQWAIAGELEDAVYQDDARAHCRPGYDWRAARKRVEAVLERHGARRPTIPKI